MRDPYLYDDVDVLRNLGDIRDAVCRCGRFGYAAFLVADISPLKKREY